MRRAFALLNLLLACAVHAETWRFVAIGDIPYSDYERREFPRMLGKISEEAPDLIVHAGDIKFGSARCNDERLRDRKELFDASPVPLVYVPGDNEWTDCGQLKAGNHDPVERLEALRKLFFAEPFSLGKKRIPVERQSAAYPEHLRWQLGPVLFVTLNVPGPDNNHGSAEKPGKEFLARNPLVIDWLSQAFSAARREKSEGIVIVMQANPGFRLFEAELTHGAFRDLLEALRRETLEFPGQVLLIHGDTHRQRIDRPMRHPVTRKTVANFTRLETFGFPFMGWVKIHIDGGKSSLFRFETHPYSPD